MKPDPSLTEEQMKQHNVLYARANELSKGLILLDDVSFKPPGFFGKRRLRKAVELYKHVLEINSKNWPSMFAIAKAFQSLGEFQQSLDWFIRAHEGVPENPSVAKEVGYAASRLGKHDVALQAMGVAAKQNPNDAALHCNLGLSCLMAGKVADACLAFEQIVQLEPEREVNKQLLLFARDVESGKRPIPKTEEEISKAI